MICVGRQCRLRWTAQATPRREEGGGRGARSHTEREGRRRGRTVSSIAVLLSLSSVLFMLLLLTPSASKRSHTASHRCTREQGSRLARRVTGNMTARIARPGTSLLRTRSVPHRWPRWAALPLRAPPSPSASPSLPIQLPSIYRSSWGWWFALPVALCLDQARRRRPRQEEPARVCLSRVWRFGWGSSIVDAVNSGKRPSTDGTVVLPVL